MQTVLFLCTGNYFRSRFSELWFNHQIALLGRCDDVHAVSAGLNVRADSGNVGAIAKEAQAALQHRGVAVNPTQLAMPRQVSRHDVEQADVVVAVDADAHRPMVQELFPDLETKIRFWRVKDLDEVDAVDDPITLLQQKIDQLIKALISGH